MSLDANSYETFNLRGASILLVESGTLDMEILVQILSGFGGKNFVKADTVAAAQAAAAKATFDLIIVDSVLRHEDGCRFVSWIRRDGPKTNRSAPLIVVSPHTLQSKVLAARDCGAHFVVAKPLTPAVLLGRIFWVAHEQRQFVITEEYIGPDRRWRFDGPPAGHAGRRADDLSGNVGQATEPNMSQSQIDALMQPKRVSL